MGITKADTEGDEGEPEGWIQTGTWAPWPPHPKFRCTQLSALTRGSGKSQRNDQENPFLRLRLF